MAETIKDAETAFDAFIAACQMKYDKPAECLAKDREALLAFQGSPATLETPAGREPDREHFCHRAGIKESAAIAAIQTACL